MDQEEQFAICENGITFDFRPRPSLERNRVVATFEDSNLERQKVELTGTDLTEVIEELLPLIKGEDVPSVEQVFLHMNLSNPIFLATVQG